MPDGPQPDSVAMQLDVAYSMQAANPRPDVAIESIDVVKGDGRATPALLGITLGEIVGK